MGFISRLNTTGEKPSEGERLDFLIQAVRVLLVCIKQLNNLPPEIEDERYRKSIEVFNEAVGQEQQPLENLQKSFVGCRTAILAHSQLEKHYLKKKETELREIISMLVQSFTIFGEESNSNLSELERCTEQLEVAKNLDDLSAVRQVLSSQVAHMKQKLVVQRQRQGLLLSQMNEKVSHLSAGLGRAERSAILVDPLTGCGNKAGVQRALKERLDAAVLKETSFAVLVWDVDNLKEVNDRYGNLVGDGVLRTLVKQCFRMVRGGDYLGRWSGGTFVVLLDDVDQKMATRRGREIVKAVASLDIMLQGISRSHALQATVSMGVATVKAGDSPESLLARAEKALAVAKKSGKNRCEG